MNKPDGTVNGPQHHHYALYLAHRANCEHTCEAHLPSIHRPGHGRGPMRHHNPNLHAHRGELLTLPDKARTGELALALYGELHAPGNSLPPHLFAAIHAHVIAALAATDSLPAAYTTLGPSFASTNPGGSQ